MLERQSIQSEAIGALATEVSSVGAYPGRGVVCESTNSASPGLSHVLSARRAPFRFDAPERSAGGMRHDAS